MILRQPHADGPVHDDPQLSAVRDESTTTDVAAHGDNHIGPLSHDITNSSSVAETGNPEEGIRQLNDVIAEQPRLHGPQHPRTVATRYDHARWASP